MPGTATTALPGSASAGPTARFTRGIAPFEGFGGVGDPERFVPLPDDWSVGVADVVASTEAIEGGRYKSVNTAGASVISAVSNALGTLDFPFIFAGDGASFAVADADAETAAEALAATIAWVGDALGLRLRGAMVPVRTMRDQGLDVQVARFSASADVAYSMFAGGGLAWAEQQLKAGAICLPPAPPGARPNLSGLSCRFQDLRAKHGVILSLLMRPRIPVDDPRFRTLVADLLSIIESGPEAARPVPVFHPRGGINLRAIALNARLDRRRGEGWLVSLLRSGLASGIASLLLSTGATLRGFSAKRYLGEVVANSDFRKYDDGLMMTLDCNAPLADALERRLAEAEAAGVAVFGLHRQSSATVTCVVPSATTPNHVHFIDGAAGGYAMAAANLKGRLASTAGL